MKTVNQISNLVRSYVRLFVFFVVLSSIVLCSLHAKDAAKIPSPQREFRAAWVATVANIDWPTKKGLSTAEQQQELLAILDRAVELNLNAIIFQVRPHCDALYASELEPWSEYLSGTMGQAPKPYYDPLEFVVAEAHQRGLELHAWFNPYRALHPGSKGELAATHVSKTQPHIVRKYGKYLWLDPGEPDSVEHNVAVILDVVNRYDVDGIHFDDYFYPYQIKDEDKKLVPFPDDSSWQQAQAAGNTLDRDDWRRQNVDLLIHRLADEIHQAKPHVKFGISPFGIWRPGNPPQIKGFDAYASLYADAKLWWKEGWVDYLTPQLYWKIEKTSQSYPVLMQWWHKQNEQKRHLWIGNYTSRVALKELGNWTPSEITQQIKLTRTHPGATGNVHFSMKALMDDSRGMAAALKNGPYAKPALVPASPWLGKDRPAEPTLQLKNSDGKKIVSFDQPDGKTPWLWAVRTLTNNQWKVEIYPGHENGCEIDANDNSSSTKQIAVSAISRTGVEGPTAILDFVFQPNRDR